MDQSARGGWDAMGGLKLGAVMESLIRGSAAYQRLSARKSLTCLSAAACL